MKVLIFAQYIYDETLPEFTKNKTGFGMMVNDMVSYAAAYDEVSLLTRVITKGKLHNGYKILRHTWKDIFSSLSIKYLIKGLKYALSFKQSLKDRLRYVFYYLDAGYTKRIIKNVKPDVVHIHGIGYITKSYIEVCKELKIPYVVTLHGLVGINNSVLVAQQERDLEKSFLIESEKKNIPVTVISSGIKKRIIDNYGLTEGKNIRVITNGTNTDVELERDVSIKERYGIPNGNKIIACIGNLTKNKNQMQIVEAFPYIDCRLRKKISVLFIGNDTLDRTVQKRVSELGYMGNFIHCGFVKRQDLHQLLGQSDINVFPSINDGFGLSMVEGFVHGIPAVTFSDLDAIEDLYHEKAMVLVDDRSEESLARGIEKALSARWDREWIQQYSKKFSLENMAKSYQEFYTEMVTQFAL